MTDTARRLAHEDIKGLDVGAWIGRLKRSVAERVQEGRVFPDFPSAEIQRQFVGSAYEDALDEAGKFYAFARESMEDRAYKRSSGEGYLDFGCGWGRIGRFFLRDFSTDNMVGVDIDPDMVAFCADANSSNAWLAALSVYKDRLPQLRADLAQDGIAYLPSGGGAYRESDVYGDTTVTAKFVAKEAAPHGGEVVRYVDDPAQFWQAAVVIRKRAPEGRPGFLARLRSLLTGKA